MLWIAPLTIYLLSFSISFDHRRWYKRIVFAPLLIIAVVAVCYLAAVDFGDLDIKIVVSAYLLAFFVFPWSVTANWPVWHHRRIT